jgi:hypothetical protein
MLLSKSVAGIDPAIDSNGGLEDCWCVGALSSTASPTVPRFARVSSTITAMVQDISVYFNNLTH